MTMGRLTEIDPFDVKVMAAAPCIMYNFSVPSAMASCMCRSGCCSIIQRVDSNSSTTTWFSIIFNDTNNPCPIQAAVGSPPGVCYGPSSCISYMCSPFDYCFPKWTVKVEYPFLGAPNVKAIQVDALVDRLITPVALPSISQNLDSALSSIIYFNSTVLPDGLVLQYISGTIEGAPQTPGIWTTMFSVIDVYTRAHLGVANISFYVRVCSPSTCLNGGVCQFPYINLSCDCSKANGTGPQCEIVTSALTSSSSSATTGIIVGVVFGALFFVGIVARMAVMLYRRFDRSKEYHIFISYRVATDVELAKYIYNKLQTRFLSTGHRIRFTGSFAFMSMSSFWVFMWTHMNIYIYIWLYMLSWQFL